MVSGAGSRCAGVRGGGIRESAACVRGLPARRREAAGDPAILLVPDAIRAWVAKFTRPAIPELNVLAYNEVPPDRKIRLVATVGG